MFWELYQTGAMFRAQQQSAEADSRSRRTERELKFSADTLRRLERRLDSLTIGCQAMWELLSEQTDLTTDDLKERMHQIDLRDGVADGKISPKISECDHCGRPVNMARQRCIYCGHNVPGVEPFG